MSISPPMRLYTTLVVERIAWKKERIKIDDDAEMRSFASAGFSLHHQCFPYAWSISGNKKGE